MFGLFSSNLPNNPNDTSLLEKTRVEEDNYRAPPEPIDRTPTSDYVFDGRTNEDIYDGPLQSLVIKRKTDFGAEENKHAAEDTYPYSCPYAVGTADINNNKSIEDLKQNTSFKLK